MKYKSKIWHSIIIALISILLVATPVFAIADPNDIWFGTNTPYKYVRVFENVAETGDMLFVAEGFVDYVVTPTDYTASEAFLLEVRSVDNTAVLVSRPLQSYGERPISIYQTAAQVTALGLTTATAYNVRITGLPLIFAPMVEGTDMVTYSLANDDWIDQSLATVTNNPLRNACIYIAENMEVEDAVTTYLISSEGIQYLTPTGADLFLAGIPSLNVFVPSLFQITTETMTSETPDATGDYITAIQPLVQLGPTISNAITNVGVWFGVSQAMAAGLLLFSLMVLLSVWLYKKTQSGLVVLAVGVAATLPVGTFLGLSSLVLIFALVILIVLLMGYYFLTRGAL